MKQTCKVFFSLRSLQAQRHNQKGGNYKDFILKRFYNVAVLLQNLCIYLTSFLTALLLNTVHSKYAIEFRFSHVPFHFSKLTLKHHYNVKLILYQMKHFPKGMVEGTLKIDQD